jgi:hypothetical protein
VKKRALIRPDFSLAVEFGTWKWKNAPTIPMASDDTRNDFYVCHGRKSTIDYLREAKKAHCRSRVFFLTLAGRVIEAVARALQYLKTLLSLPIYDFVDRFKSIDVVQYIRVNGFEKDPVWKQIIALSYHFAAYNLMWRGYATTVEKLVSVLGTMATETEIDCLTAWLIEVKTTRTLILETTKVPWERSDVLL